MTGAEGDPVARAPSGVPRSGFGRIAVENRLRPAIFLGRMTEDMRHSPMPPAVSEAGTGAAGDGPQERAASWLGQAGLRPTRQRLVLAGLLVGDGRHRHVTAEWLHASAADRGENVSLATVYNTLGAFCAAGLLREIRVDGAKSYFDTNTTNHPHFYWEDSARISDAPASELEIRRLPHAPDGCEIAAIDVVIRLRRIT